MARVKTYTNDGQLSDKDYLLGGDADNLDATKTYLLEDVRDYVSGSIGLQEVLGIDNTIVVNSTTAKGIDMTLSNNSTLYQNGIVVTVPQQTGDYPTYNPAPDAFMAVLNGQNPGTLSGSPVGFLADITGADNYGFIADLRTGASTSVGCDMRSFDGHTGNLYLGSKYISGVRSDVFKVDNDGDITAKSFIKIGGTSAEYLMADGTISIGGIGTQGPQGVQGPAGPLGPVGPAGLTWRGSWTSGTSYIANDAVGYNGASWFCILATSGTTTPNLATTNWALLASQGAQGIQGVQGPTGAQGPPGGAGTLQQTVDNGNTITDNGFTATLTATNFKVNASSTSGMTLSGSQIIREKNGGSDLMILQFPSTFSGVELINLPNTSGTIALQKYKSYIAYLSYGFQTGYAILVTEVYNDLGVTPTWAIQGSYPIFRATATGIFTLNKTVMFTDTQVKTQGSFVSAQKNNTVDSIDFQLTDTSGDLFFAPFDDLLVEIRVYN